MNQEQTKDHRLDEFLAKNDMIEPTDEIWLHAPNRTPTFSAWMESLNERKVKRAGGNYSEQKFQKNWSTSRR